MPHFSDKSLARLNTCDLRLQNIMREAIEVSDFSILCGHRDKATQDQVFKDGMSQLRWPDSRHNKTPALAVDVAPYPIQWPDAENDSKYEHASRMGRFYFLAGLIMGIAHKHDIGITWGGAWRRFKDYGHFELKGV